MAYPEYSEYSGPVPINQLIRAELPYYEPPPPWIPPEKRQGHPDYDNDLRQFLPRSVKLSRQRLSDTLGFNIRGGNHDDCGIFVSKVMEQTEAERVGLREGDQILRVNGRSLDGLSQAQVVQLLKSTRDVLLLVRYFPYAYNRTHMEPHQQQIWAHSSQSS